MIRIFTRPMLSIYKIKPAFQQLLKPLLTALHRSGVTANHITISSIILSLLIGIAFWHTDKIQMLLLVLPVGLLIRMALNALDGMMARTYDQQSKEGEVLNELGDVVSDFFIYFPLLKLEKTQLYLVALFLILAILNEFAGVLSKVISGQRRYDGPMGKSDRAFFIGLYGLFAFFDFPVSNYSFWVFITINLLLIVSTGVRIKKSFQ